VQHLAERGAGEHGRRIGADRHIDMREYGRQVRRGGLVRSARQQHHIGTEPGGGPQEVRPGQRPGPGRMVPQQQWQPGGHRVPEQVPQQYGAGRPAADRAVRQPARGLVPHLGGAGRPGAVAARYVAAAEAVRRTVPGPVSVSVSIAVPEPVSVSIAVSVPVSRISPFFTKPRVGETVTIFIINCQHHEEKEGMPEIIQSIIISFPDSTTICHQ